MWTVVYTSKVSLQGNSEARDLICMYMYIVNEGKNAHFLVNFTLNK